MWVLRFVMGQLLVDRVFRNLIHASVNHAVQLLFEANLVDTDTCKCNRVLFNRPKAKTRLLDYAHYFPWSKIQRSKIAQALDL